MRNTASLAVQDAGAIMELATAFTGAKLVLSAVELDLFTSLADGPASETELRTRLGLHERGAKHFFDALVRQGLLELDAEGYRNSPGAQRSLVRGGDLYIGSFLGMANRIMYQTWGKLTEALRSGQPQVGTYDRDDDMFPALYNDPEQQLLMLEMTEDVSRPIIPELARIFEWHEYASVVEVGGCRGNVVGNLVKAFPHLRGCVFDLPQLEPAFTQHMATLGLQGRLGFQGGDFFTDPLPEADVLMIGHTLVDWDCAQRQTIIRNTFPAVRHGGALVVYDPMLADEEARFSSLVNGLNLQLMTPTGGVYGVQECEAWMRDAGYTEVSHRPLASFDTLVIARKRP